MQSAILQDILGVSREEVANRDHNIWVGVSDSPVFHSRGVLEKLIQLGIQHTRERLLIWIPGRMYSSNAFHIDKKSRAKALRYGFEREALFRRRAEKYIRQSHPDWINRIEIIGYDELLTPAFVRRRSILYEAFSLEGDFYQRIVEIAKDYLHIRGRTVTTRLAEAIAVYQLQELPMFLAPVQPIDSMHSYTVEIYPGLGKFDHLARDIVEGSVFPELTRSLLLTESCGQIDVRIDLPTK